MKRLLIAFAVVFSLVCTTEKTNAQVSFRPTVSNPSDSLIDAGSDTLSITLTRGYSAVSIQPVVTVGSGSVGSAKSRLYYSVNGTNYVVLDSLTLSTSTSTIWTKSVPARYWKIITSGATTVRAKCSAKLQTN